MSSAGICPLFMVRENSRKLRLYLALSGQVAAVEADNASVRFKQRRHPSGIARVPMREQRLVQTTHIVFVALSLFHHECGALYATLRIGAEAVESAHQEAL